MFASARPREVSARGFELNPRILDRGQVPGSHASMLLTL
jgi:hypothetical protein